MNLIKIINNFKKKRKLKKIIKQINKPRKYVY
jgi:hypothetical protein